jgi:hypothetical protein
VAVGCVGGRGGSYNSFLKEADVMATLTSCADSSCFVVKQYACFY